MADQEIQAVRALLSFTAAPCGLGAAAGAAR